MIINSFRSRKFRNSDPVDPGTGVGADPVDPVDPEPNPLQEQLDALAAENARLQAKIGEANKHAKAAERAAAEEARKKAEAEGNFKQLFESSEQERETLAQRLAAIEAETAKEKINTVSLKVAGKLAEGYNAELLAEQIAKRLKFVDGDVKVIDGDGNLTVSKVDDLEKEFASSARFASLLKGNQSSGGSASGSRSNASGATNTISRAEFDTMSHVQRSDFAKKGGKVINE